MTDYDTIMKKLESLASPHNVEGMSRFGMTAENRLGISIPDLRKLAKEAGRDHALALKLWTTGIAEARILASMVDVPTEVTEEQMDEWVRDFNSWDICDQVCMNLFEKTAAAWSKPFQWFQRDEEYVRRAAFALIACLAWHSKNVPDQKFLELLPLISGTAHDHRNFVRKAVSWALRNIGKRNEHLYHEAIKTARELQKRDSKTARWIASDTVRDLDSPAAQRRIKKKPV